MEQRVAALEASFAEMKSAHANMAQQLQTNTTLTTEIANNTKELIEIFKGAKLGVMLIRFLGRVLVWAGGIALAGASLWGIIDAIKSGRAPLM